MLKRNNFFYLSHEKALVEQLLEDVPIIILLLILTTCLVHHGEPTKNVLKGEKNRRSIFENVIVSESYGRLASVYTFAIHILTLTRTLIYRLSLDLDSI